MLYICKSECRMHASYDTHLVPGVARQPTTSWSLNCGQDAQFEHEFDS